MRRSGGYIITKSDLNEDYVSILESLSRVPHPRSPRLNELVNSLPKLSEADVDLDAVCPICLIPFRAHLAEEELALAMDSPAHPPDDLGVTRLADTCGHFYCYKCISAWIRQPRSTCPTCRRPLLPSPPLPFEGAESVPPAGDQQQQQRPQERPRYEDVDPAELPDPYAMLPELYHTLRDVAAVNRIRNRIHVQNGSDGGQNMRDNGNGYNGHGTDCADDVPSDQGSGRDRIVTSNGEYMWDELMQMYILSITRWQQQSQAGGSGEGEGEDGSEGDREHHRDRGERDREHEYPDRSEFGMYS